MNICCFFNHNPFYRLPIFNAIAETFECDFYFNASLTHASVPFDVHLLKGYVKHIPGWRILSRFVISYRFGSLLQSKYTHYLLSGDSTFFLNWFLLLWSKIMGKKVFFWTHGLKVLPKKRLTKTIYHLFYGYADGIFLYGEYGKNNMLSIGCKEDRLHVIHNSLDTNVQTTIYNNLTPSDIYKNHFGNNDPTIIYIGRIQKRKRVDLLVKAFELLRSSGVSLNMVIVGSSMDDDSIPSLISSFGLSDRVWLFGPCYDERMNAELLYNASVCVSPGNVGLTCIHSLSYGTPVVSHNTFNKQMPEFEAIKEGITGSFFLEDNVESLSKEILRWISLGEAERAQLRMVARETIEREWSIPFQISVLKRALK